MGDDAMTHALHGDGGVVRVVGWDIETHYATTEDARKFNPFHEGARTLTVAWYDGEYGYGGFVDFPGKDEDTDVLDLLDEILADPEVVLVGHNVSTMDAYHWRGAGLYEKPIAARLFDTRVAHALLHPEGENNSLAHLCYNYLDRAPSGELKDQRHKLIELPPDEVLRYNQADAVDSYELYAPMMEALEAEGMVPLAELCMASLPALVEMMVTGVHVDLDWIAEVGPEIRDTAASTKKKLDDATHNLLETFHELNSTKFLKRDCQAIIERLENGEDPLWPAVNWGSPKQLINLMFKVFGWPVLNRTKTKQPATGKEALMELQGELEDEQAKLFIDVLLEHKLNEKLVNTYLQPLALVHACPDQRIHCSYFMGRSYDDDNKTGGIGSVSRLASSKPNLQNIPRDSRVKGAFAPTPGYAMFDADYSQIELRIGGGWYAGEPVMLEAIAEGRDIHTAMLAELEDKDYDWVVKAIKSKPEWKEKRALIKPVNFGVFYGVTGWRLMKIVRMLGISMTQRKANQLIATWFRRYSSIHRWIIEEKQKMVETGKVVTPTGRMRELPNACQVFVHDDGSEDGSGWGKADLRKGINFLVQSLAFEVMISALRHTHEALEPLDARLVMTVHDSLVGEYNPKNVTEEQLRAALHTGMLVKPLADLEDRFGITDLPIDYDVDLALDRWGQ